MARLFIKIGVSGYFLIGVLGFCACSQPAEDLPYTLKPTCADGQKNQGEIGVDCGGPFCEPCDEPGTCEDGFQNQSETGVDCGGPFCEPCQGEPSCADGVQNQDETGIDCGGPFCQPCDQTPTCQDGIRNQNETGIDCGGSYCPPCEMTLLELCVLEVVRDANGETGDYDSCQQAPLITAGDFSAQELAYRCRPGTSEYKWADKLLTANATGRVEIDWGQARQCLRKARELRALKPPVVLFTDPAWIALEQGICKTFYSGKLVLNQTCIEDWDCPANSGCYTFTPSIAGSRKCIANGQFGDTCGDWRLCDEDFWCEPETLSGTNFMTGTCGNKLTVGSNCEYASDCVSGVCDEDTSKCVSAPSRKLGEACATSAVCDLGSCGTCRPLAVNSPNTCQLFGLSGEYCRDWNDCANDLGCVNNLCGTVAAGAMCGDSVQALCSPSAVCLGVDEQGNPTNCELISDKDVCNQQRYCAYDLFSETCEPSAGRCVEQSSLPKTGPCYSNFACAVGSHCNSQGQCVVLGELDASCDADHPCNSDFGFGCQNGTCKAGCKYIEDCPVGNFCDTQLDEPMCTPFALSSCRDNKMCPADNFCKIPGDTCRGHSSAELCAQDEECSWLQVCIKDHTLCGYHMGPETCAADKDNECVWQEATGLCLTAFDCSLGDTDASACDALANCEFGFDPFCAPKLGSPKEGICTAKLPVGAETVLDFDLSLDWDVFMSERCVSGYLAKNPSFTDSYVCTEPPASCVDSSTSQGFLSLVFMFGGVVFLGHKRRSK